MASDLEVAFGADQGDDLEADDVLFGGLFGRLMQTAHPSDRRECRVLLTDFFSHKDGLFPLARRLGLPNTPRQARRAQRDLALRWLAELINRHVGQGTYSRWVKAGEPNAHATAIEQAVHQFVLLNAGATLSAKQISRVIGHVPSLKCPSAAATIAPVDARPPTMGRSH